MDKKPATGQRSRADSKVAKARVVNKVAVNKVVSKAIANVTAVTR
jgi:hypothetical protein